MAKICSQCHNSADDSAAFCDICGTQFQAAQGGGFAPPGPAAAGACPNCGMQNLAGELYCESCGMQLPPVMVVPPPPPVAIGGPAPEIGIPYNPPYPPIGTMPGPEQSISAPNPVSGRFIVSGSGAAINFPTGKDELVIGRSDPDSHFTPDIDTNPVNGEALGVSRRHARLLAQAGQVTIEDLGSTNFTFVNRQRLQPGQRLAIRGGDEVRLGRLVLVYSG